jgi:hypothetical protein
MAVIRTSSAPRLEQRPDAVFIPGYYTDALIAIQAKQLD